MAPFLAEFASPHEWAAMYRGLGLQVVPGRSGEKRPLGYWQEFQHALVPQRMFDAWFGPTGEFRMSRAMGLLTGACSRALLTAEETEGLFLVDLDVGEGKDGPAWWRTFIEVHLNGIEPQTWRARSGGGGEHHFFLAPKGWVPPTFKSDEGVDVRGQGGYVVVAPAVHPNGSDYAWVEGFEPWAIELAMAPPELTAAIDKLHADNGGGRTAGQREHKISASEFNEFGLRIDGREHTLAERVWGAVVDLRRASPTLPSHDTQEAELERLWVQYERVTKSRLDRAQHPGLTNGELLEQEDRGRSMLRRKWADVMRKWDGKVADAAAMPKSAEATQATEVEAGATTRGITAADLKGLHFAPITWIVPDLIPEGLTLLAGKPKSGKSWLTLDTAIAVATGGEVLGRRCGRGDCLVAALEDNLRRLQRRMAKLCIMGPWPERLTFWHEMKRLDEGGIDQLREWIASATNPKLIIIDVYARVRRPMGGREQLYDYDYKAALSLKALADETGVAIVIVHHQRKMKSDDDPFDTISGTTGLTGASDTVLVLLRAASGVTLYGRGRDIEEVDLAVEFSKDTCRWSVLGDADTVRMSSARRAILEMLQGAHEPMSPKEVALATGQNPVNVRQLLATMAKAGEVERVGGGKYRVPNKP